MSAVSLAVYDLSRGMARAMSQVILGQRIDGIWHTGIVVFGQEYFFGGGVQTLPTGVFAQSQNLPVVEMQDMGTTTRTKAELETYLRSISSQFTQATYDLINNNCNHFADTVCRFLTGHGIPESIVDLPRIVFSTPNGAMLRPMIESMQNNIRQQQGGGLDPFANAGQVASRAPEPTLSRSMTSLTAATVLKKVELQKPLVSGDGNSGKVSVASLGRKLLSITSLSDNEKEIIQNIINALAETPEKEARFTMDHYILMEKILAAHPETHVVSEIFRK